MKPNQASLFPHKHQIVEVLEKIELDCSPFQVRTLFSGLCPVDLAVTGHHGTNNKMKKKKPKRHLKDILKPQESNIGVHCFFIVPVVFIPACVVQLLVSDSTNFHKMDKNVHISSKREILSHLIGFE